MNRVLQSVAIFGAAALTGCATVPREAEFPRVANLVAERTGQKIHWNQGGPDDRAVATEVREMLRDELAVSEAVQVALLNNRNLQATYESLSIAQADLVAAGLLRNPVFDAEIRFTETNGHVGAELAVVQDFIDILYIPLRKRVAAAAFEATKQRVAGAAIDLAGEVRAAYYTLQASVQTLEMRRHVLAATDAAYDLAKRLHAAGNINELELSNERALYEQTKLDVRSAELAVVRGRERLNTLMGVWGTDTQWRIASRLPDIPSDELTAEHVEARAVERSLELAASKYDIERAAQSLGIARPFGILPEAEVGVSAEREPDGEWAAGPALSLPLPIFNQGQPAVASAQAEFRRARELYTAQAIALRAQARTSHAAVVAARDQALYYAKVVLPLREQIVEQTQLQFNAMQVGAFQLLQAKQQQIDAGNAYVRALRDYWVARTELDQLLAGRMTSFESATDGGAPSSPAATNREGH